MYGYITQVDVDKKGKPTASKLMTMGRFSHELG